MEWPWSHYLLRSRRKDCSSCSVVFVITWEYNFQIIYSLCSLTTFFFFKLRLDSLYSFSYCFILPLLFLKSALFLNQGCWILFTASLFFFWGLYFKFSCHSLYKDRVAQKAAFISHTIKLLRDPPIGSAKIMPCCILLYQNKYVAN